MDRHVRQLHRLLAQLCRTRGIAVALAGAGMRAYAALTALVPGLWLPAAATVGGAGTIVDFGGTALAVAGHFKIGCTP